MDETKNITITKAWNDENNQDGLRPKSITAVVNGSDGSARFVQLFESQNWTTSLNNLPKYKNSTEVQYTVKENAISGYETEIKQTGDSYTITNTHAPAVVTVSVVKIWDDENNQDGIRPSLIQVTLTGSDGSTHNAAITKNDGWTYQFKDLPQYKNGVKIDYTLQEVTVKLTDGTTVVSTKEVKNDSWKHIFEDIPVFNGSDKVSYTITQDAVNGYTTEIKASDDGNTIEIINTHIPVVPPKEEPKKEEPATPAPVVEVKVEQPAPTVTLIQTTNKPTGISFFESLFAK